MNIRIVEVIKYYSKEKNDLIKELNKTDDALKELNEMFGKAPPKIKECVESRRNNIAKEYAVLENSLFNKKEVQGVKLIR